MSDPERIKSIIASAKKEYEDKLHAEERIAKKRAQEWKDSSKEGTAWLREHVIPKLHALRQDLAAEGISAEIDEKPAPQVGHHFVGPAVSLRLVAETLRRARRPSSQTYIFHCSGDFLSISHESPSGSGPLGMPFDIGTNPREADEMVFEIIRKALSEYYDEVRKA